MTRRMSLRSSATGREEAVNGVVRKSPRRGEKRTQVRRQQGRKGRVAGEATKVERWRARVEGREGSSEKRQRQGKGKLKEGQKVKGKFGDVIVGLRLLCRLDTRVFDYYYRESEDEKESACTPQTS